MQCKNLVSVADLELEDIDELFALTTDMKRSCKGGVTDLCLAGKTLGMIFEKSSMRTRVSFEVAMTQTGGHAIYLTKHDINLGERESIKDVSKVLSRFIDCIAIRTYDHETVTELAEQSNLGDLLETLVEKTSVKTKEHAISVCNDIKDDLPIFDKIPNVTEAVNRRWELMEI